LKYKQISWLNNTSTSSSYKHDSVKMPQEST